MPANSKKKATAGSGSIRKKTVQKGNLYIDLCHFLLAFFRRSRIYRLALLLSVGPDPCRRAAFPIRILFIPLLYCLFSNAAASCGGFLFTVTLL